MRYVWPETTAAIYLYNMLASPQPHKLVEFSDKYLRVPSFVYRPVNLFEYVQWSSLGLSSTLASCTHGVSSLTSVTAESTNLRVLCRGCSWRRANAPWVFACVVVPPVREIVVLGDPVNAVQWLVSEWLKPPAHTDQRPLVSRRGGTRSKIIRRQKL